ncbi:MAG: TonB-dependent receptor [Pseudomonadota bacterium]
MKQTKGRTSTHGVTSVASAVALALAAPTAIAQDAVLSRSEEIAITRQPLGDVLIALSTRYGVTIMAEESLVAGKVVETLTGSFTVEEALEAALRDSGLTANRTQPKTYVIVAETSAQQSTASNAVDEILVVGSRYFTPITNLTRSPADLQEIPNSLTIINSSVIQDQLLVLFDDTLKNVAGYQDTPGGGGEIAHNFSISLRGVRDSLIPSIIRENSLSGGVNYQPDPYTIDRVEVIKGPAAIAGGGAPVGGLVNRVLKTANTSDDKEFFFGADSFGQFRAGIDVNHALNDEGGIYGRLVVGGIDGDLPNDRSEYNSIQVTPSVLFDNGGSTTLLLQANYIQSGGVPFGGVPVNSNLNDFESLGLDRRFNWNFDTEDADLDQRHYSVQADVVHKFLDDLSLTVRATTSKGDGSQVFVYSYNYAPGVQENGDTYIYAGFFENNTDRVAADVFLRKDFDFGSGSGSSVVAGVDFVRQSQYRFENYAYLGVDNLFAPQNFYDVPDNIREIDPTFVADLTGEQIGAYVQAVLRPTEDLTVIGGLRYDDFSQESATEQTFVLDPENTATASSGSDGAKTWRLGASYDIGFDTMIYASYSRSFLNNAFQFTLDTSGPEPSVELLSPMRGEQYEIGFKSSLFDGGLFVTGAVYDLVRSNVATTDPNNRIFSIGGLEETIQGLELEASGQIMPGLDIVAAYTLIDGEITEDADPTQQLEGTPIVWLSEHQLSVFATYELQSGPLQGLGFGGRVFYRSEIPWSNGGVALETDAFTTIDLTVTYDDLFAGFDVRLYLENATDEFYVANPIRNFAVFGYERNVRVTFTKAF